jgi:hypothetical protein
MNTITTTNFSFPNRNRFTERGEVYNINDVTGYGCLTGFRHLMWFCQKIPYMRSNLNQIQLQIHGINCSCSWLNATDNVAGGSFV